MTGRSDLGAAAAPTHELHLVDPNDLRHLSAWDIDFRQIEPGPMKTRIFARSSPRVTLLELHMDRAVHQQGCSPGGTITLGLPVTSALQSWRGAQVDTPGLINFGKGSAFEGVNGPDFAGLTVSISETYLIGLSDRLGLPLPDDFLRRSLLPVRRRSAALHRLCGMGAALLHNPGAPFGDLEQENFVASLLAAAADAEAFDDRSARSLRAKAVSRAVDLMQDRVDDGLIIGRFCADAGASWRTLTRGFRERFGIGPKAYFNRLRLTRVRSMLLQGSPTSRVADAANRYGFWHMGQFAKDYSHMFGELPSETLKSAGSTKS
jgi:AraC-like DNA-binding protein